MTATSRSFLTAGLAALGAGAIALTPVQPIPNHLAMAPQRVVDNLSVDLAAAIDPITPWVNAIEAAAANAYALQDTFNEKPFPILQTIVQNQFTYLSELPNIGLIFKQITGNIGNALSAPLLSNEDNINNTQIVTNRIPVIAPDGLTQRAVWGVLPLVVGVETWTALEPALLLTTIPLSGFLLGFAGPGLSSMIQLQESIQNIFNPPPGSKPLLNAINEIINLPANLFNAAFNGGKFLDLKPLVDKIAPLPESVQSIGIRTGGFLNGGGVAFDGVSAKASLGQLSVEDSGIPVGFIGATGSLANYVADAIKVTPPARSASVAPAAATAAVKAAAPAAAAAEAPAPVAETPAAVKAAAAVADDAPAPKRQSRAATRADNSGAGNHSSRANRGARHAG